MNKKQLVEMVDSIPRGASSKWRPNVHGVLAGGSGATRKQLEMESDLEDGWRVAGELFYRDGRVRLRSITFTPPPNADTVLSLKLLRRLNLSWVYDEWDYLVRRAKWLELPDEWRKGMIDSPRPGRRGHPPAFYALWVERYLKACDASEKPVELLLTSFPGETKSSINSHLRKAERDGLIGERPGRGKAGGVMTAKCQRILNGEET